MKTFGSLVEPTDISRVSVKEVLAPAIRIRLI
jgi:hypothetical protein